MKLYEVVQGAGRAAGLRITRSSPVAESSAQFVWHARQCGARTALDVGANTGRTGVLLRREGWTGTIVSFEPLPAARVELEQRAAGDAQWHVAPSVALGADEGQVDFHITDNSESSSILPTAERSIEVYAKTRVVETMQVRVARLDDVMEPAWGGPYAMKLDTQGFELEVLKGAPHTLAQTQVVMLEMSLTPLYEGSASFEELYAFMLQHGFRCVGLHKGFSDLKRMEMLQVDGVFVRC